MVCEAGITSPPQRLESTCGIRKAALPSFRPGESVYRVGRVGFKGRRRGARPRPGGTEAEVTGEQPLEEVTAAPRGSRKTPKGVAGAVMAAFSSGLIEPKTQESVPTLR